MAELGPDPLRPDADPHVAWQRIQRASRPVAALLMDQKVLSGVGNVYRAEVLFRNRIDPHRAGQEADPQELVGDLVGPARADADRGPGQPDRHRTTGAHPRGDGPTAAGRRPRRRGLRLPPGRPGLPGLRLAGPDRDPRRAQPVLVRAMPTPRLTFPCGPATITLDPSGSVRSVVHGERAPRELPARRSAVRPRADRGIGSRISASRSWWPTSTRPSSPGAAGPYAPRSGTASPPAGAYAPWSATGATSS